MPDSQPIDGLAGLVREAARRSPDAAAVHCGAHTATYRELDDLADRYAAALRARGVAEGDRVVIWAEKSIDVVALTQATLRLGALYVPVAPSNPAGRVMRIVSSCAPALVLTGSESTPDGWPQGGDVLAIAALRATCRTEGDAEPVPRRAVDGDDPAYILYTSGSTGEPKGVCLSHGNALAFVRWAAEETGLRADDRLANHAPLNFDLSVFDLYGAFLAGAAVDLIPSDLAYAADPLVEFLRHRGITVWYSVPSVLVLMTRYGQLLEEPPPPALRVCAFAGEPFPVRNAAELRAAWPGVRMFNWYGPTETNVCASYELTAADATRESPLPIGGPASGATLSLDEEGEIVVTGPTVMLGYWGRERHCGPYRTGDLGRYRGSELQYLGRRDAMVKLRGHRIELGEIEAVLTGHASVAAAAVTVVGTGIDAELHAVVMPAQEARPTLLALKAHCARHLPRYMLLDSLSVVDELPRTANGKIARTELIVGR